MDSLVSNIRNIKIFNSSMFRFEDISFKYEEYLDKLSELDPVKLKAFIMALKKREIVNNQETEMEESFFVELYQSAKRRDSIEVTMKCLQDGEITKEELKRIHRMVIKGSADDLESNYDFRKDNNKWVGSFDTCGGKMVDYYPPEYTEIDELLDELLSYLNEKDDLIDNVFLKPLVFHACLAYVQPFGNGNTRLARVIQHGKICELTNQKHDKSFKYPTLYLSKNYLLQRPSYRGLIKDVSVNKDDEAWNRWFKFNLNMIDEQLFYLGNQLEKYKYI